MSTYDEEWKRQQLEQIYSGKKRSSSPRSTRGDLRVTSSPKYSTKRNTDGTYSVTVTVEIDGKAITTTSSGHSPESAKQNSLDRFQNAVYSEHSDRLRSKSDVMSLGQPTEINSEQMESKPTDPVPSFDEADQPDDQSDAEGEGEAQAQSGQEEQTPPEGQVHVKGLLSKHHRKPHGNADGKNDKLKEPVPPLVLRPGEAALSAATIDKDGFDNNAVIIFGRDFSPDKNYSANPTIRSGGAENLTTTFSDHMGAGAIDILVGRMAPFPILHRNEDTPPTEKPEYRTSRAFNTAEGTVLKGADLLNGKHPGTHMDAARIYITQMTDIDHSFRITDMTSGDSSPFDSTSVRSKTTKLVPTSAIMLKADKVRLHSRQDIKIVSGGPFEKVNSQGNNITRNNGIHIIAENGIDRNGKVLPQHPMVLGGRLEEALIKMVDLISNLSGIVDNFAQSQMQFNDAISHHFHLMPPAYPTAQDFLLQLRGIVAMIDQTVNSRIQLYLNDINGGIFVQNYLKRGGSKYINSKLNTVN